MVVEVKDLNLSGLLLSHLNQPYVQNIKPSLSIAIPIKQSKALLTEGKDAVRRKCEMVEAFGAIKLEIEGMSRSKDLRSSIYEQSDRNLFYHKRARQLKIANISVDRKKQDGRVMSSEERKMEDFISSVKLK